MSFLIPTTINSLFYVYFFTSKRTCFSFSFTSTIVLDFSLFRNAFYCLFYFLLINMAVFTSAFLPPFYFRHKDLEDSHDRRYFKDVRLMNLLPVIRMRAGHGAVQAVARSGECHWVRWRVGSKTRNHLSKNYQLGNVIDIFTS